MATTEGEERLEVSGLGGTVRVEGRRIVSNNLLNIVLFGVLAFLLYKHHISDEEYLQKILEATAENTYVLSLSQADRERLNISMPESLRQKLRRREQ